MLSRVLAMALMLAAGSASAAELRDPTRPPSRQRVQTPHRVASLPVLRSILVSPHGRVAQIGARRVREGDQILGGRVARIERTAVTIDRGEQELVLRLAEPVITRSPGAEEER